MSDLHASPEIHKAHQFPLHEAALRQALAWLRARHDGGAVSPAVFAVLKMVETKIAWRQHRHEGAP